MADGVILWPVEVFCSLVHVVLMMGHGETQLERTILKMKSQRFDDLPQVPEPGSSKNSFSLSLAQHLFTSLLFPPKEGCVRENPPLSIQAAYQPACNLFPTTLAFLFKCFSPRTSEFKIGLVGGDLASRGEMFCMPSNTHKYFNQLVNQSLPPREPLTRGQGAGQPSHSSSIEHQVHQELHSLE